MSDTVRIQAARNEQSKADKSDVLAKLRAKKPRRKDVQIMVDGEKLTLVFQAISLRELDALQSKHSPTVEQRSKGMIWNADTFPPALVAACSFEPKISEVEAKEMWTSDVWSMGELSYLYNTVEALCMEGMNVPFSETD